MATKRTNTKKVVAKKPAKRVATKKVAKEKVEAKAVGPRHPKARVTLGHGGKEAVTNGAVFGRNSLDDKGRQQEGNEFGHATNPGNESIEYLAPAPMRSRAG